MRTSYPMAFLRMRLQSVLVESCIYFRPNWYALSSHCRSLSMVVSPTQYDRFTVKEPSRDRTDPAQTAPKRADEVGGPAQVPIKHFGVGNSKDIGDGGSGKTSGVKKRGKTVFGRNSAGRRNDAGGLTEEQVGHSEETSNDIGGAAQSASGEGGGEERGGEGGGGGLGARGEGLGAGAGGGEEGEGGGGEGGADARVDAAGGAGEGGGREKEEGEGGRGRSGGTGANAQVSADAYRDPADGVAMEFAVGGEEAGPLETFLAEGKKLPIVLLTCNREALLRQTIQVCATREVAAATASANITALCRIFVRHRVKRVKRFLFFFYVLHITQRPCVLTNMLRTCARALLRWYQPSTTAAPGTAFDIYIWPS